MGRVSGLGSGGAEAVALGAVEGGGMEALTDGGGGGGYEPYPG